MNEKLFHIFRLALILSILSFPPHMAAETSGHDRKPTGNYITVRTIPSLDKLPLTAIHRIFQDSEGYIWYGTFDGLCRYDGYNIKTFRSDINNPDLLRDNYVSYIEEGKDGKIWIGTMNGLYLLDKSNYSICPVDLGEDSGKNIFTLSCTDDGNVWASIPGRLYRLDKDGKIMDSFSTKVDGNDLCAYFVRDMPGGKIITSLNTAGMYEIDLTKHTIKPYFHNPAIKDIEKILPDEENRCYWLGTWGSGIVRFDPGAESADSIFMEQPAATDALGNPARNLYHMVKDDNAGYIWATTERDLFAFETKDGKHLLPVDIKEILPEGNKLYYEIFKDNDGSLWVSSFDNPSIVLDFNSGEIIYDTLEPLRKKLRSNPMIMSMTVASDGSKWFFLDGYSLFSSDRNGNIIKIPGSMDKSGLSWVFSLSKGSKASVWAISGGPTAINIGRSGNEMRILRRVDFSAGGSGARMVNAVVESRSGKIWGATDKGIMQYGAEGNISAVKGISCNMRGIVELPDGSIRAIGERPGIYKVDKDLKASVYKTQERFNKIAATSEGELWLSTAKGDVYSFDSKKKTLVRQTSRMGLSGEKINDIIIDRHNHVWIVSNQFVREYNPRNGAYLTYSTRHENFPLMRFTENSSSLTPEGNVCIGGIGGTVTLPATMALEGMPKNVETRISDIIINGESRLSKGLENKHGKPEIKLRPEDENIEIHFSALNYRHPDHIRYAYRMEGVDKDWVYTRQRRNSAFYNHLSPGSHTFAVKATDHNGLWSDKITYLEIYRKPFWHETWWAKLLAFAIVLATLWLVIMYYRKIRHQKYLRERLKELLDERVTSGETTAEALRSSSKDTDPDQAPQSTEESAERQEAEPGPAKPRLSDIKIKTSGQDLLQRAVECVESHLGDETFDVVTFASDMNMSKATLSRKLKGMAGQSPAEFVREIRMRHAARLLTATDASVTEVAEAVGYSDTRHFASRFKATFGVPPTQYKAGAHSGSDPEGN